MNRTPGGGYAQGAMAENEHRTETVSVEVHDPQISEHANEVMTREVRDALGTDQVELPSEQARRAGRTHPGEKRLFAALWERRIIFGVSLGGAVVVAAILVLTTGSWWWIALPLGLHVAATLYVTYAIIDTTTLAETPSADSLAALEAEGVRDPERAFSEHLESFVPAEQAGGRKGGEGVFEYGANVRTTRPYEDPGGSAVEQETAMTPSSVATSAAPAEPGQGGADVPDWPVLLPAFGAGLLMLAAIIIPLVAGGGLLWIMVAAVWPPCLALVAYEAHAYRRAKASRSRGEGPESSPDTRG